MERASELQLDCCCCVCFCHWKPPFPLLFWTFLKWKWWRSYLFLPCPLSRYTTNMETKSSYIQWQKIGLILILTKSCCVLCSTISTPLNFPVLICSLQTFDCWPQHLRFVQVNLSLGFHIFYFASNRWLWRKSKQCFNFHWFCLLRFFSMPPFFAPVRSHLPCHVFRSWPLCWRSRHRKGPTTGRASQCGSNDLANSGGRYQVTHWP